MYGLVRAGHNPVPRVAARRRVALGAARRDGRLALRLTTMPTPDPPSPEAFALITVTHNSAVAVAELLRSVACHLPGVRVVVVDNASGDDTLAVARSFPQTVVVALPDNVGFGRANNRGLAEVSEPVAVLVNPDVELLDASLRTLAAEAATGPERLLAPLVLSPNGSRQDTAHPWPASAPDVVRALVAPGRVPGRAGTWLEPWRSATPRRIGWAVGCALVARTATLGPLTFAGRQQSPGTD